MAVAKLWGCELDDSFALVGCEEVADPEHGRDQRDGLHDDFRFVTHRDVGNFAELGGVPAPQPGTTHGRRLPAGERLGCFEP